MISIVPPKKTYIGYSTTDGGSCEGLLRRGNSGNAQKPGKTVLCLPRSICYNKRIGNVKLNKGGLFMTKEKDKTMNGLIVSLVSLLCAAAFIIIGFTTGIWHPTWVIFFAIPILRIILNMVELKKQGGADVNTEEKK
jgi:hypothetical protein